MKRPGDDSDEDDVRAPKRPNFGAPGSGFSGVLPEGFAGNGDMDLAAMLQQAGAGGGFSGGGGKGKGGGVKGGEGCFMCGGDHLARECGGGRKMGDMVSEGPKVATTQMDFSQLSGVGLSSSAVSVQRKLVEYLMTPGNRQLLIEESGSSVEWAPKQAQALLSGSPEQVKRAQRLLARVMMHCRWGCSEEKVRRLLKPRKAESVLCRLSPMSRLRPAEKTLTAGQVLTIGKGKTNMVVVEDPLISREHAILELAADRGAVYVLDCSTNGTFLNGVRLPHKKQGKVLLSHGDELLLKDPASGDQEFGYIVNLNELHTREEMKLEAPRRLLGPEDSARPDGGW